MRILYIHQYFITPNEPGGTRSYWVSRELIERGHEITILTTKSNLGKNIIKEKIDGIFVVYFPIDYNQSLGFFKRVYTFLNFTIKASWYALSKRKEYDLILATSTPLTVGIPALLARWLFGKKLIFEVRDLWPEVPIQMGILRNPLLITLAKLLEKTIYKYAEHIIALSPGMESGVLKYVTKDKVTMIPNMAKVDKFWPRQRNTTMMKELGLSVNSLKIIHFGSIGLANNIESLLDSAKLIKHDLSIQFIILGGGAMANDLKKQCLEDNLENVLFCDKVSMDLTSEIVNFCDISYVSFKDIPILYTNSPNKFFDSLSAGKPIILNSSGWTKDMVETNNCGYYVNPNDPADLVNKIKHLQNNPDEISSMGKISRSLAENFFDKSILCAQFADLIERQNV